MGVHDGHRDRLRRSFIEYGLDSFSDVNALELLLFYAIPRRDTNETSHELLNRFGSLSAVFDASQQELCQVPGIGENTAALIKLVPQILKKARVSETSDMTSIRNSDDAGRYLMPRFINEKDELVLMLCLDSRRRVIKCIELGRGVVNSVEINIRRVVETALKCKADSVIIAHNHPEGIALPSNEDKSVTRQIFRSLDLVGITLADHIIVAGEDYVSFSDSGMFRAYI